MQELVFNSKDECHEYLKSIKSEDDFKDVKLVLNFEDASRLFKNWRFKLIPILDTSKVTNMVMMFSRCYSLESIPELDTSKVTDMGGMFEKCYELRVIPELDTSKVTDMGGMFFECKSLLSIPQLDTSKVTGMSCMFYRCYLLESIPELDTSKVTNMFCIFRYCNSLRSIPKLDTSKVTDMKWMFDGCKYLKSKGFDIDYAQSIIDQLPIVDGVSQAKFSRRFSEIVKKNFNDSDLIKLVEDELIKSNNKLNASIYSNKNHKFDVYDILYIISDFIIKLDLVNNKDYSLVADILSEDLNFLSK